MSASSDRGDIYQRVTDTIVAAIEAGAADWKMPWHVAASQGYPTNVISRKAYRGINVPMLWSAQVAAGYGTAEWGTYKQWAEKGAQVRKGEKATPIVYWDFQKGTTDANGDELTKGYVIARGYVVFNAAQVDGYKSTAVETPPASENERIEHAETFFANLGATVGHGGNRAYYRSSTDAIQMPEFVAFRDAESYYSVLAHEHIHWTMTPARCDRSKKLDHRYGSESYAVEELVAELGAAFYCAESGLTLEPRPDHAQYINTWLSVLKADKKAIFTAATAAQKAVAFLNSKQPADETEPAESPEMVAA